MSNWEYNSGGKAVDDKKYSQGMDRIFGDKYDDEGRCKECGLKRIQGHKLDCSHNWRADK